MRAERVAELRRERISLVVANDAERRSFSVIADDRLLMVAGDDLEVVHEWRLPAEGSNLGGGWGSHGAALNGPVALLSTPDAVRLLEPDGSVRWSFAHASWVGVGSGCAWFDENGRPCAVVAAGEGTACRIVALDPASGVPLAEDRVEPNDPAGMSPLHQREGWVGIAEGEGENAARAWWIRRSEPGIELQVAPWDDEHLSDVDQSGRQVVTTALSGGRIRTRSFPSLEVVREIDVEGEDFILSACLVGERIVARLYYRQVTAAIDGEGRVEELDVDDGWLVPAADSWLSVRPDSLRRWALS